MKMEQTECSETLEYKIQTPRNYPEESIKKFMFLWNFQNLTTIEVTDYFILPYCLQLRINLKLRVVLNGNIWGNEN